MELLVAEVLWSSSSYDRKGRNQKKRTVPSTCIQEIITNFKLDVPVQLICDIEGGEHDLITNEIDTLADYVSILIFEYHNFLENDSKYYYHKLRENGFSLADRDGKVYVYKNDSFI